MCANYKWKTKEICFNNFFINFSRWGKFKQKRFSSNRPHKFCLVLQGTGYLSSTKIYLHRKFYRTQRNGSTGWLTWNMLSVTYPKCNPELHPSHISFGMVLSWWDNQSIIHLHWDTPYYVELSITKIICRKSKLLRPHVKYHCRHWNCSWQQLLGNVMTSGCSSVKPIPDVAIRRVVIETYQQNYGQSLPEIDSSDLLFVELSRFGSVLRRMLHRFNLQHNITNFILILADLNIFPVI